MFLHSGASLHGHEYSVARSATSPPLAPPRRHIPLLRSALRPLSDADINSRGTSPVSPAATSPAPSTATHTCRHSMQSSPSPAPLSQCPPTDARRRLSHPYPIQRWSSTPPPSTLRPLSVPPPKRECSVRFLESVEVMDETYRYKKHAVSIDPAPVVADDDDDDVDADAVAMSDCSDTPTSSVDGSRKRRAPRKSTTYILAQPAPRLATKQRRLVQIRPRLLVQLQRITETRPKPAFDALPSAQVSGTVVMPRLARKFPRLFRMKPELGLDDIILARSEDYDAPEPSTDADSTDDDDELDRRDVIGVVSPVIPAMLPLEMTLASGMVQISLEDDNGWFGFPLANGSYEFVRVDDSGNKTVARWVAKPAARRPTTSGTGTGTTPAPSDHPRYIFSMIDPTVRRHPVLATMTSTSLEVNDQYTSVSPRPMSHDPATPPAADQAPPERELLTLDEATRNLITATAVWVNLRNNLNWPSASACITPGRRRNSTSTASKAAAPSVTGSPTMAIAPIRRSATCTAAESAALRTFVFERRNTPDFAGATTPTREGTPDVGGAPGASGSSFPRRAVSTGAAFMRRRRTATLTAEATGDDGAAVAPSKEEPKISTKPEFDASCPDVVSESDEAGDLFKTAPTPYEIEVAGTKPKGFKRKLRVWKERMSLRIKAL